MKHKPLHNNLLVKVQKEEQKEETTQGGIVIPDAVTENRGVKKTQGVVVAVGNGKLLQNGERASASVAVGDTILFFWYPDHGTKVTEDGEEYLIVNEDDVVGVMEG